ncbi:DUF1761 domain-containing protein [Spirosoma sp. KUDC1026]|uniref:DUF1761 domain-containing protein n=1 Tax=Spirosoma sp. KUDC1026 TaxID=2745947 RepID=UPI00159BB22F|nr:DUF1761 domain-containing protein [Spirosoma sp. KUDC1026]QKZ14912.1 DUF1761 domain-containing protein [Spirosoma sp. KUDC1026]
MFNVLSDINWLSVLAAFVPYFLLGSLWYMLLFPKPYRISLGRDANEPQSLNPLYIVGPAVCALIITVTCAVLLQALNVTSYANALQFTLIVGLGYLFANTVNIAINPNIPRPFLYGLITGSYHLVGMALVNMILVAMR